VADSHYFGALPSAASRPGLVQLDLLDGSVELVTDRGVFAADRLDAGTLVLLEVAPPPPATGHLLDLGCGYGPIAVALARRAPGATVWAVDVNRRAVELAAANAARLGLGNVRAVPPEAVPEDLSFSEIWSNPPIRVGKAALHDMLRTWLARLRPGGQACLVVGRNLGADSLHSWLEEDGWPAARIAARAGYRLLLVTNDPERTRQISHDTVLP
jgi:16S rRNA (guanine1207-N2)-methyltransferase